MGSLPPACACRILLLYLPNVDKNPYFPQQRPPPLLGSRAAAALETSPVCPPGEGRTLGTAGIEATKRWETARHAFPGNYRARACLFPSLPCLTYTPGRRSRSTGIFYFFNFSKKKLQISNCGFLNPAASTSSSQLAQAACS